MEPAWLGARSVGQRAVEAALVSEVAGLTKNVERAGLAPRLFTGGCSYLSLEHCLPQGCPETLRLPLKFVNRPVRAGKAQER